MKAPIAALCTIAIVVEFVAATTEPAAKSAASDIERGRYLVAIAGCNDCHTPGYAERAGDVPEAQWLVGDRLGWSGPWGTTYPANLRLFMQQISEEQWFNFARTGKTRPPMPWFTLRDMTDDDLRAVYRYVRSIGPAGERAPDYVPPGKTAAGPVVAFPQ
jgi:mono/diheme cytochrome c family protein